MFDFKLQVGSLLIILFYILIYIKETAIKGKVKADPLFCSILLVSPCAVFFDGATAWSVNRLDTFPSTLNLIMHLLFFLTMNATAILVFFYMARATIGLKPRSRAILFAIPGIISNIVVVCAIGQLYYVHGVTTNYSMGISVYACFISVYVHFMALVVLLVKSRNLIENDKKFSVYAFVALSFLILGIQVLFPEVLISSLLPPICVISIFENFENPYVKKLHKHNRSMLTGFATLVENRDDSTGSHIHRTQEYVQIILDEMRKDPEYRKILDYDYISNIVKAAPMHDIGKISTPDNILQKPGKLTPEEYEIMKQHSVVGGEIIQKTFRDVDNSDYLKIAYDVARYHHEKWDGTGYPDGLKGEEIPLHSRIMAIADVFDAVSADRCYRVALPLEECFSIIEDGSGTHFDPKLAQLFLNARSRITTYYNENN